MYVYIGIKHLAQIPGKPQKRYLYGPSIGRLAGYSSQSVKDGRAFMKRVEEKTPFKFQTRQRKVLHGSLYASW